MSKRVRVDGFVDACSFGSLLACIPHDLLSHGYLGAAMPASAGEQPSLWFVLQAAPVLAQRGQQLRAQHDVAILTPLAADNMVTVAPEQGAIMAVEKGQL